MEPKWQLIKFAEIDKPAIKSYCAVHNVDAGLNLGDVSQIDTKTLPDFTMLCGGTPCQSFSVAGKQHGVVWTCNACHYAYNPLEAHYMKRTTCPKSGSKNITKTRSSLLIDYLRVLHDKRPKFAVYENVKNVVSARFRPTFELFLKELHSYGYNVYYKVLNAKDYGVPQNRERLYMFIVDKSIDNGQFSFPKAFNTGVRLKDVIDNKVEDKFYLNDAVLTKLKPLLNSTQLDNKTATAIVQNPHGFNNGTVVEDCTTITAHTWECNNFLLNNAELRKLTPRECWRLMGFADELFDKAKQAGVSDTQLYKQAGNSIVTDVLYHIYHAIYKAMPYLFDDLKVLSLFSGIGAFEVALDRFFDSVHNKTMESTAISKDTEDVSVLDTTYTNRTPRIYTTYTPTLRAGRSGFLVAQPQSNTIIKLGNVYPSGGQNGGIGSSNAPKILVTKSANNKEDVNK